MGRTAGIICLHALLRRVPELHEPPDMHAGGTLRMWSAKNQDAGGPPAKKGASSGAPGKSSKPGKPGKAGKAGGTSRPRKRWVTVVKWAVVATLACTAIVALTVALTFWMYGRDPRLPQISKLADYRPKQVTTILDANDR